MTEKKNYINNLAQKILKREGEETSSYTDPVGIPTYGPGYALVVRGADGRFTRRSKAEIEATVSGAVHGAPGKWTMRDDDYARLGEAAEILNRADAAGNRDNKRRVAEIEPIVGLMVLPDLNDESRKLIVRQEIEKSEQIMNKSLDRAARTMPVPEGMTREGLIDRARKISGSPAMGGLVSLTMNGLPPSKMPKATAHLLSGNRAGAYYEIVYRSNAGKLSGIAGRRIDEAIDILGDPKDWSPADRAALARIGEENADGIHAYEAEHSRFFRDGKALGDQVGGAREDARKPGADANADADADAIREALSGPFNPLDIILGKPPADWTETEMRTIFHDDVYSNRRDPRRDRAADAVTEWFRLFRSDESGSRPPIHPKPARTRDGVAFDVALRGIGGGLVEAARRRGGLGGAVKQLQSGLNDLADGDGIRLKRDGKLGPKTRDRLVRALVENGRDEVAGAMTLAPLGRFVRAADRTGRGAGLGHQLASMAPLPTGSRQGPAREGRGPVRALQKTLNEAGAKVIRPGAWRPIAVDGVAGPKTERAFEFALRALGPKSLMSSYRRRFGGS